MKLSELLAGLPVGQIFQDQRDPEINRVVEDSRTAGPGDLFIARTGTKHRGEDFIPDAMRHGAAAAVLIPSAPLANTKNPTLRPGEIVAQLAHRISGHPAADMKIFAVTGTNGKTTISYLVQAICTAAGGRCGLISTVQTDDGLMQCPSEMTTPGPVDLAALFLRMKQNGVGYVAMEASSHALEQDRLAGFTISSAMFSNLTGDHLDYHGTMEKYAAAKARLFEVLPEESCAVINADDTWSSRMVKATSARVIRYATDKPADFHADIRRMDALGMDLKISHPQGSVWTIKTELVGKHNAQNILCAVAACSGQGIAADAIIKGIETMRSVPGRLQPVLVDGTSRSDLPFQVLVDYAHTHDALENVLQAIRPWTKGRVICVFGCGGGRDMTKRPKMAAVAQRLADAVIVTSDNPRNEDPESIISMIVAGFSKHSSDGAICICPDRREAIRKAINMAEKDDVVLIAGKGHENYQILGAVKHPFDDVKEARDALAGRYTANVC